MYIESECTYLLRRESILDKTSKKRSACLFSCVQRERKKNKEREREREREGEKEGGTRKRKKSVAFHKLHGRCGNDCVEFPKPVYISTDSREKSREDIHF